MSVYKIQTPGIYPEESIQKEKDKLNFYCLFKLIPNYIIYV
jgi:hypothetical protein